jgi:hypothetical protein
MGASLANAGYFRSASVPARSRVARCKRKFLRFFPEGFRDETYLKWERRYKWRAHQEWQSALSRGAYRSKLSQGRFLEIGAEAIKIESRTNLLFSFEKMAIRDALKSERGARDFAEGLYALLYGSGTPQTKFTQWCEVVAALPRKQSRVLTWPVATVFGFIAQPETHIFLKPTVTRLAAEEYGFDFRYRSRPSWETYSSLLEFAHEIGDELHDLRPRDLIDIQSFIWVLGSDEYEE